MDQIVNAVTDTFASTTSIFILSLLPLIELRGAIPIGIALGLPPVKTFAISYIGSMIPVPLIILLIRPLFGVLRKTPVFKKIVTKIEERTLRKSEDVRRRGLLGLFIFVAIPLPGTGVWTGSMLSALLNIRLRIALPIIAAGNLVAGIALMILSQGAVSLT